MKKYLASILVSLAASSFATSFFPTPDGTPQATLLQMTNYVASATSGAVTKYTNIVSYYDYDTLWQTNSAVTNILINANPYRRMVYGFSGDTNNTGTTQYGKSVFPAWTNINGFMVWFPVSDANYSDWYLTTTNPDLANSSDSYFYLGSQGVTNFNSPLFSNQSFWIPPTGLWTQEYANGGPFPGFSFGTNWITNIVTVSSSTASNNYDFTIDPIKGDDTTAGKRIGSFKTPTVAMLFSQGGESWHFLAGSNNITGHPFSPANAKITADVGSIIYGGDRAMQPVLYPSGTFEWVGGTIGGPIGWGLSVPPVGILNWNTNTFSMKNFIGYGDYGFLQSDENATNFNYTNGLTVVLDSFDISSASFSVEFTPPVRDADFFKSYISNGKVHCNSWNPNNIVQNLVGIAAPGGTHISSVSITFSNSYVAGVNNYPIGVLFRNASVQFAFPSFVTGMSVDASQCGIATNWTSIWVGSNNVVNVSGSILDVDHVFNSAGGVLNYLGATFDCLSNTWSLYLATNNLVNGATRFHVSSNGIPVDIKMSNGVPYIYTEAASGGGIIP